MKPFLGVLFRCCNTYGRLYKNEAGDRYEGRCPACGRQAQAPVAPNGTKRRFFEAVPTNRKYSFP